MSSSSDDNYDEAISSDKEAMEVDSDEQLLDDAEPVEESKPKEVKKHKRSFDPRYAVPTNEEKQMMRDADMEVEVSMIEMEVSGRCLCHCLVHSCCSLILLLSSFLFHSYLTPLSFSLHSLFILSYHSFLTPPRQTNSSTPSAKSTPATPNSHPS